MKLDEKQFDYICKVADRMLPLFEQYGWDIYGLRSKDIIIYKIEELAKQLTAKMVDGDWARSGRIMVIKETGSILGFSVHLNLYEPEWEEQTE